MLSLLTDEFDREFIEGGDGDEPFESEDLGDDQIPLKYIHIARETKAARLVVFEIVSESLAPVQAWMPKFECALGSPHVIWAPRWMVKAKNLEMYSEE